MINIAHSARLRNADGELWNTQSKVEDLLSAICPAHNAASSDVGEYLSLHLSLRRD
jgi:hypothetical protein